MIKNAGPGGPLQIEKRTYSRGLYVGSVSRLAVHLPARGQSFEAVAALNLDWFGCGYSSGSAIYTVEVGGKEAFRSGVATVGCAGLPVKAALGGATEFVLVASTPEASPACPANVWAEGRVTLEDGRTVWLDELPVAPLRSSYTADPQFSFTYGGGSSVELLKKWPMQRQVRKLDDQRTEYTLTYKDPETGLVLRSAGVEYRDFPTVEWTLYFENTGTADTPFLRTSRPWTPFSNETAMGSLSSIILRAAAQPRPITSPMKRRYAPSRRSALRRSGDGRRTAICVTSTLSGLERA